MKGCNRCGGTGIVEVFCDDWPANCNCNAGDRLELARLEKENEKLRQKQCLNAGKINKLIAKMLATAKG